MQCEGASQCPAATVEGEPANDAAADEPAARQSEEAADQAVAEGEEAREARPVLGLQVRIKRR